MFSNRPTSMWSPHLQQGVLQYSRGGMVCSVDAAHPLSIQVEKPGHLPCTKHKNHCKIIGLKVKGKTIKLPKHNKSKIDYLHGFGIKTSLTESATP